jgi:DNA gyrase inhibitor GyrI
MLSHCQMSDTKLTPEKRIAYAALALIGAAGLYWLISNSRFFTPNVRYILRRREGAFEIRDYPNLAVAETVRDGNRNEPAFNRLFSYIQGQNSVQRKIPMTAPVLFSKTAERNTMSFVMPEELAPPPEPRDPAVEVNALPARRYAVFRFQGWPRWATERKAIATLRAWLIARNFPASADPILAYYDPPWIPSPLRRNEVLIEIPI